VSQKERLSIKLTKECSQFNEEAAAV